MPVYSVKKIEKSRKPWLCATCRKWFEDAPKLRLFGCGCVGDSPYVIYECLLCAALSKDERFQAALLSNSAT